MKKSMLQYMYKLGFWHGKIETRVKMMFRR